MRDTPSPKQNRLLATLPVKEFDRLSSKLERVSFELGEVLYETGSTPEHVYFPTTSIVSLLYVMANGDSAEIAVIGNEGVVGISFFMGGGTTTIRAVVQNAGDGYRLAGRHLKGEFACAGVLQDQLLRYTQALMTQITQTAACNRHHEIDEQLCRWLLLSLDRLPSDDVIMTQELLAKMLGVSGELVKCAAGRLQDAGLIVYDDGRITLRDRLGLEERSCECYQVVKTEYDRLLPASAHGHIEAVNLATAYLSNEARSTRTH